MRRAVSSLLIALICLPLCACWDALPLEERCIILGIGIDLIEDAAPGEPRFEFTFVSPLLQESRKYPTEVRVVRAHGFCEAVTMIEHTSARTMFLGKVAFVMFGQAAARAGVVGHINELLVYPEMRLAAYVLTTPGRAKEALTVVPPDGLISQHIQNMLRRANRANDLPPTNLDRFSTLITAPDHDPAATELTPIGSIDPRPKENRGSESAGNDNNDGSSQPGQDVGAKQEYLQITAIGLWQGDRLQGHVNLEESHYLHLAAGTVRNMPLLMLLPDDDRFTPEDSRILLRVLGSKPDWKLELVEGRPRFHLRQVVNVTLEKYTGSVLLTKPENTLQFRRLMEETISRNTLAVLQKVIDTGCDPLGLGEQMRVQYPAKWDPDRWRQLLQEATVTVETRLNVRNLEILIRGLQPSP